jgi:hypothetical protein
MQSENKLFLQKDRKDFSNVFLEFANTKALKRSEDIWTTIDCWTLALTLAMYNM